MTLNTWVPLNDEPLETKQTNGWTLNERGWNLQKGNFFKKGCPIRMSCWKCW